MDCIEYEIRERGLFGMTLREVTEGDVQRAVQSIPGLNVAQGKTLAQVLHMRSGRGGTPIEDAVKMFCMATNYREGADHGRP